MTKETSVILIVNCFTLKLHLPYTYIDNLRIIYQENVHLKCIIQ